MAQAILGAAAMGVTAGCAPGVEEGPSYWIAEYFDLEATERWRYADEDGWDEAGLVVEKAGGWRVDGVDVVTLDYAAAVSESEELGEWTIHWSSEVGSGITIHGFSVPGEDVEFDYPMRVATTGQRAGDTLFTDGNGGLMWSTFEGNEECAIPASDEPWDCMHFKMGWSGNNDAPDPPFIGDWWLAPSWGPVRMELAVSTSDWVFLDGELATDGS